MVTDNLAQLPNLGLLNIGRVRSLHEECAADSES